MDSNLHLPDHLRVLCRGFGTYTVPTASSNPPAATIPTPWLAAWAKRHQQELVQAETARDRMQETNHSGTALPLAAWQVCYLPSQHSAGLRTCSSMSNTPNNSTTTAPTNCAGMGSHSLPPLSCRSSPNTCWKRTPCQPAWSAAVGQRTLLPLCQWPPPCPPSCCCCHRILPTAPPATAAALSAVRPLQLQRLALPLLLPARQVAARTATRGAQQAPLQQQQQHGEVCLECKQTCHCQQTSPRSPNCWQHSHTVTHCTWTSATLNSSSWQQRCSTA